MHDTFFLVLGLVGLLTIASLLLPLANRINFPYTVLLALAGSLLGVLVLAWTEPDRVGLPGDFLNALETLDITSEVVFFVFLPALIFESALNINARHLMADLGPILLLAVIGLLISTLVVGFAVWSISAMGLVVCLLIGTIVSATDPIAVIAIFKNLGAPKRLTILVEGESLLNDATAIVAFTILAAILVGGTESSLLSAAGRFLVVFLGGILVGLVSAWLMASIIGRLRNLPLVEITLTICLAYLSFLLAEHYLHVSGVMAVVTAGLMINSFGRTQVSPETWHALTETWEELAFWANSLIFFLVGLLVPRVLAEVNAASAIALAVLTLAAFLARALVLFGVLPALSQLGWGQRISPAFRTVMLWGGLRGAVSLALALVILETPAISAEIKQFVAVLVTGFVLFTLFVNAPTMGMVMRFFGLDQLAPAEQAIRNRVMALSLSHIREGLERAARQERIAPAIATEIANEYQIRLDAVESTLTAAGELPDELIQQVGLTTLVNHERYLYLKHFAEGLISATITRILMAHADDLLDGLKARGVAGYQATAKQQLQFGPLLRGALLLQRRLGIDLPLARALANRFEVLRATETLVTTLIDYNQDKIPALLGDTAAAELAIKLSNRLAATRQGLEALARQYPDYAETLQKRHLARVALRLEEADYRRMLADQVISQEAFNDLGRDLDRRARTLDQQPRLDLGLEPQKLVARVPFFAGLPANRLMAIAKLLTPRLVVPGDRIIRQAEPGESMYFISSGAVQVDIAPEPVCLGSGDFFGEMALLTQEPRNADVTAIAYCQLLMLPVQALHGLLADHADLRECLTRAASARLNPDLLIAKVPLFADLANDQIAAISRLLTPLLVAPGDRVVHQGDPGNSLYFVATGAVDVMVEPAPRSLYPGDFFGEIALLTQQPRSADVIATRYSQLLMLKADDFQQLLASHPGLRDQINQVARQRLGIETGSLVIGSQVISSESGPQDTTASATARQITNPPSAGLSIEGISPMNKNRFGALCSRCCIEHNAADSATLFAELIQRYSEPQRHYHTCAHIEHCLEQFDMAKSQMSSPDAVEMALWFHDAIYQLEVPDNEQQSADLFRARLGDRIDPQFAQQVVELILLTTHQAIPAPGDGQYMVDIDLSSFGLPWQACRRDALAIRAEHPDQPDTTFFAQQNRFLQSLLDRPQIYASEWFRNHYESQARGNIQRLMTDPVGMNREMR
ncbi:MAG: cation:proton antiporter [Motiliproteus sp.]